jgi:hypothetical protein
MEHLDEDQLKNQLESQLDNLNSKIVLFDTFQFNSNEDVNYFINNLTNEDSNSCIIQAIVSAYKRGAFTMIESEVISKSLRLLNK